MSVPRLIRRTLLGGVGLSFWLLAVTPSGARGGDYIVVLKDDVDPIAAAKRHGAVPTFTYKKALRGYAATLNDAGLVRAQADLAVAFVAEDRTFSIAGG
jgi:hypothetical protein